MYRFHSIGGCFVLEIPGGDHVFFGVRTPMTISGNQGSLRFQVFDLQGRCFDIKHNEVTDYFGNAAGAPLNALTRRDAMQVYLENSMGMG